MNILVTGSQGFLGRNLCTALRARGDVTLFEYGTRSMPEELDAALRQADVILHLAGVNRPTTVEDFAADNTGLTQWICDRLRELGRAPKVVLSSSIQAELDNPYGASKRGAEEAMEKYCEATVAEGVVYRLKNLFGKWCRPNYNSVTATFCHNIAHDLPIQVNDPTREIELTYVDDVVAAFIAEIELSRPGFRFADPLPATTITLGQLADTIRFFHGHRATLQLPDYSTPFMRALYATYLSYLDTDNFGYGLDIKSDNRGSLAEFVKAPHFGQIFVSRTHPGITRGNHYHHTKTEKFVVVEGEGVIRFRPINGDEVFEYRVRGEDYRVVDIPPGYTHHIENVGDGVMVTLFWSSEPFDPGRPDTYFEPVLRASAAG
jgi:UDP-2-acetamido-2,6-beta-L-arabino-hexul-4-ose reductase